MKLFKLDQWEMTEDQFAGFALRCPELQQKLAQEFLQELQPEVD